MKIRKGNHSDAILNSGEDNTIIDGFSTAEQLAQNMKKAGEIYLNYTKENKARELEVIEAANKEASLIKQAFKTAGAKRDEFIEQIYTAKVNNQKVVELQKNIASLQNKINESKEKNKDKLIQQLQEKVNELTNLKQID